MKALGRSCGVMDVLALRARRELEIKTKKEHMLDREASVQTPARDISEWASSQQTGIVGLSCPVWVQRVV